jgi:hypothetical protein
MSPEETYLHPTGHKLIAAKLTERDGKLYWDGNAIKYEAKLKWWQQLGIVCGVIGGGISFLAGLSTVFSTDMSHVKQNVCSSIGRNIWPCPIDKSTTKGTPVLPPKPLDSPSP